MKRVRLVINKKNPKGKFHESFKSEEKRRRRRENLFS